MVIANDGRPDNKTKRRNVAVQHNKNIPKHSNIKHIQKKKIITVLVTIIIAIVVIIIILLIILIMGHEKGNKGERRSRVVELCGATFRWISVASGTQSRSDVRVSFFFSPLDYLTDHVRV